MNKDNLVYLEHIFDWIVRIEEYTKGVDYKNFTNNNLVQAGVIRELEIIGEAAKKLSTIFKEKYPDIQWKKIPGMRDKLIHNYFGVDIDAVWNTIENDIPVLKKKIIDIKIRENKC